jgi:anthranilate synthase/aminodeoxychorismate synthase-like glutamine amidotransferase
MILIIDNYDSFTFNLVQMVDAMAGESSIVVRNDDPEIDALIDQRPAAIILSPGPGSPSGAGRSLDVVRRSGDIPILGVCLGHQAIGEALGGRIVRGAAPVHGKTDAVQHRGERLFEGCPSPMIATRYHSLVIERSTLPDALTIDAETRDGAIMAVSHRERPLFGVQFHPESYGTVGGEKLVRNFLERRRR